MLPQRFPNYGRKGSRSVSSSLIGILLTLFSFQISHTLAINLFSCCQDPQVCPPSPPLPPAVPLPDSKSIWRDTCANENAKDISKVDWACLKVPFPTTACLVADMRTCGNVGPNTVFYSFGIATSEARQGLRDKLNPRGVMFNDVLPNDYWELVIEKRAASLGLTIPDQLSRRQAVLTNRYSHAIARVATGTAYLVVKRRNGEGGGIGAYQLPTTSAPNTWRLYEFPELMRNTHVTAVVSVDQSNGFHQTTDWQPNHGDETLPYVDTDGLELPSPNPNRIGGLMKLKKKRGAPAPTTAPYCSAVSGPQTTSSAKASTLKTVSSTKPSSSHETTSKPKSSGTNKPNSVTNSAKTKTTTAQSTATNGAKTVIQLSKNNVHVGALTSADISYQMNNLLPPLCPLPTGGKPTSCSSKGVTVENVETLISDVGALGDLTWTIEDSQYSTVAERDAMLGAAIQAFANSASGKNCKTYEYGGLSSMPCRNQHLAVPQRGTNSTDARILNEREEVPPAYVCHADMTLCNAANLVTVELNQPGKPEAAYMNIEASFQLEGGEALFLDFICELIIDSVQTVLDVVAPEVIPVEWDVLGNLLACCEGNSDCPY